MAAAGPQERTGHKRPFAAWVKRLTNLHHPNSKKAKKATQSKNNNPYPQSSRPRPVHPSHSICSDNPSNADHPRRSSLSLSLSPSPSLAAPPINSNRSQAPTVATNPDTVHSDGGYFKVLTSTTQGGGGGGGGGGGALSSVDGAGPNSTFSSPNQSQQSLTTTLTTIQSTNQHLAPTNTNPHPHPHFASHPPSALPAHLAPNPQANHQVNDNASILTLASSSKRRRRSMDTDASVRAIPPRSMWGDSRESLPLSLLSANIEARPSIGSPLHAAERNSVYSTQGVSAPALASDRNSYYVVSHRHNPKDRDRDTTHRERDDGRSINFDQKSLNFDARSLAGTDVASLRAYDGSVRSGALGHGRNDSIPSGAASPLVYSPLLRKPSGAITLNSDLKDGEDSEHFEHKHHS